MYLLLKVRNSDFSGPRDYHSNQTWPFYKRDLSDCWKLVKCWFCDALSFLSYQNKGLEESLEALFSTSEWQALFIICRKVIFFKFYFILTIICLKPSYLPCFPKFFEISRCQQLEELDKNAYGDIFIKISLYVIYIVHA